MAHFPRDSPLFWRKLPDCTHIQIYIVLTLPESACDKQQNMFFFFLLVTVEWLCDYQRINTRGYTTAWNIDSWKISPVGFFIVFPKCDSIFGAWQHKLHLENLDQFPVTTILIMYAWTGHKKVYNSLFVCQSCSDYRQLTVDLGMNLLRMTIIKTFYCATFGLIFFFYKTQSCQLCIGVGNASHHHVIIM